MIMLGTHAPQQQATLTKKNKIPESMKKTNPGEYGTSFALFSAGIAQVSLRYPFFMGGGGVAPPLCMLSKGGETLRKGGGGVALKQLLRHQKAHSAQYGGFAEVVSRCRAIQGH